MSKGEPGGRHDIVLVSDLHMAAGDDSAEGRSREPFPNDSAFARFIDSVLARGRREGRAWRLVILGDLFDFPRVETAERDGEPLDDRVAVEKLERIAAAHPDVFAALGRFIGAGFPLELVPGNHDFELMQESVQDRFEYLVRQASGRPQAPGIVGIHPWIYYLPGVLYAEHGHQYHDINCFNTLMSPRSGRRLDELDLPLGWYLDHYVADLTLPSGDRRGGPARRRPFLSRARQAARLFEPRRAARIARLVGGHLVRLRSRERIRRREAYREEMLRPYAKEVGLSYETLVAIDRLAESRAQRLLGRLLRRLALGGEPYLPEAALELHRLLAATGREVPFYAFGHTHTAGLSPLLPGAAAPLYLNGGTWSLIAYSGTEMAGDPARLGFVEINAPPGAPPTAHLMCWNDLVGRQERLGQTF